MHPEINITTRESYKKNRDHVFRLYGIDPKDPDYNCHHIIQRCDVKNGLVGPNFNVNAKENLIPLRVELHPIIHQIIDVVDSEKASIDKDFKLNSLHNRWSNIELRLEAEIAIKSINKILPLVVKRKFKPSLPMVFTNIEYHYKDKTIAQIIPRSDLNKLLNLQNSLSFAENEVKSVNETA